MTLCPVVLSLIFHLKKKKRKGQLFPLSDFRLKSIQTTSSLKCIYIKLSHVDKLKLKTLLRQC